MDVNDLIERLPPLRKPTMPGFAGATGWLNTTPLEPADLRGKVVLVDFWTFTCINWIRTLPYVRAWAETYGRHGLVVVGVHTPEFTIEHDVASVRQAVRDLRVEHAVALDSDYRIWKAFGNQYWPALYLADADGRIGYHHFGEGGYESSEQAIRRLLGRAGADLPEGGVTVVAEGIEAGADWPNVRSPETYLGLARATGFASPGGGALDQAREYTVPADLRTNEWALSGSWTMQREAAVLHEPDGGITFRFHARDVNLILAPPADGGPARFRVRLDGQPPRDAHGVDVDEDGGGLVDHPRLHQLIRQPGPIIDRLFEIELLDPGMAALCFTFG